MNRKASMNDENLFSLPLSRRNEPEWNGILSLMPDSGSLNAQNLQDLQD